MKKIILYFIFISLPLNIFAQLHLELSPYLWLNNNDLISPESTPSLEEFYNWYTRPPFLNLTLDLQQNNFQVFTQIELRTDLLSDLTNFTCWNLPYINSEGQIFIDPNLPQTAYLEYNNTSFILSFGRRKLQWGPGNYGLGIASQAPYFDHIWLEKKFILNNNAIWDYNFIIITTDSEATLYNPKTLIAHRISFATNKLHLSINDYNLIYNRIPDIQEISPLAHYHSFYLNDQNVMLGLSIDSLLSKNVRLYSEIVIDDFQLSIESTDSNPGAIGCILGMQWQLSRGNRFIKYASTAENHTLKESSFEFDGGLILNFESTWTSRYLYNRADPAGEFTNPLYYRWLYSKHNYITTYFGAAYGPDSLLEQMKLTYQKKYFSLDGYLAYRLFGSEGIGSDYSSPFDPWIFFSEPILNSTTVGFTGFYLLKNDQQLKVNAEINFDGDFHIQGGVSWIKKLF